ncbi:hypothetical protein pdam_00011484, partial [Pocillopora damicornis]
MHMKLITVLCLAFGFLALVQGKSINKDNEQKVKDSCECSGKPKKKCTEETKKSEWPEKCGGTYTENKKCEHKDQPKNCTHKDQPKKCDCKAQAEKCKNVAAIGGGKKCNCKCKEGEAKAGIPRPADPAVIG